MIEYRGRDVTREATIKAWSLNHSPRETAAQMPRCTRDTICNALKDDRKIFLKVKGDKILDAYIYKDQFHRFKFHVFGFKG